MPANHKVSVAWQIVATFVLIANFWAFYRIRKLRKYLAYVFVPSTALSITFLAYYYSTLGYEKFGDDGLAFGRPASPYDFVLFDPTVFLIAQVISAGFQGFTIYLVIIWSRQHNRKFDTPATSVEPPQ
jgi:hypothetical protein